MALSKSELVFILKFKNEAQKVIKAAQRDLLKLGKAANLSAKDQTLLAGAVDQSAKNMKQLGKNSALAQDDIRKLGKEAEVTESKFSNLKKAILGIGASAVGIGVGLKAASDFNEEIAKIGALGVPAERLKELTKEIRLISVSTGRAGTEVAGAVFEIISAFGDSAKTVDTLRTTSRAAVGGFTEMAEAFGLLSAVTKAFGDTTEENILLVSDLAFKTNELGKTTFRELAKEIQKVSSFSNQLNVTERDLLATFSVLTGVTGDTTIVATQLFGVFNSLFRGSKELNEVLRKTNSELTGLPFRSIQQLIKEKGLLEAFVELRRAAGEAGVSMSKVIPEAQGLLAVMELTGNSLDTARTKFEQFRDVTGATDRAFQVASASLKNAFDRIKAAFNDFFVKVGDAFAPLIFKFAELIESLATAFIELAPVLQEVIAGFIALAGAIWGVISALLSFIPVWLSLSFVFFGMFKTLGFLFGLFKKLGVVLLNLGKHILPLVTAALRRMAVAMLLNPWTAAVAAVVAVITVLVKYRDEVLTVGEHQVTISTLMAEAWHRIQIAVELVRDAIDGVIESTLKLVGIFVPSMEEMGEAIDNNVISGLGLVVEGLVFLGNLQIALGRSMIDIFEGIGDVFKALAKDIQIFFAGQGKFIMDFGKEVVDTITGFFVTAFEIIVDSAKAIGSTIAEVFSTAVQGAIEIAGGIAEFVTGIFSGIVSFFSGVVSTISEIAGKVVEFVREIFGSVADWVAEVFGGLFENTAIALKATFADIKANFGVGFDQLGSFMEAAAARLQARLNKGRDKEKKKAGAGGDAGGSDRTAEEEAFLKLIEERTRLVEFEISVQHLSNLERAEAIRLFKLEEEARKAGFAILPKEAEFLDAQLKKRDQFSRDRDYNKKLKEDAEDIAILVEAQKLATVEQDSFVFAAQARVEAIRAGVKIDEEALAALVAVREELARSEDASKGFGEGFKAAATEWADAATDAAAQGKKVFDTMFNGISDLLVDFLADGEFTWRSFADTMRRELIRIAVNDLLGNILGTVKATSPTAPGGTPAGGGGVLGWIGSLLTAQAGQANTSSPAHARAQVPALAFAGAPQFAMGGMTQEVRSALGLDAGAIPAILHGNEAVIPLTGTGAVPLQDQAGKLTVKLPGNRTIPVSGQGPLLNARQRQGKGLSGLNTTPGAGVSPFAFAGAQEGFWGLIGPALMAIGSAVAAAATYIGPALLAGAQAAWTGISTVGSAIWSGLGSVGQSLLGLGSSAVEGLGGLFGGGGASSIPGGGGAIEGIPSDILQDGFGYTTEALAKTPDSDSFFKNFGFGNALKYGTLVASLGAQLIPAGGSKSGTTRINTGLGLGGTSGKPESKQEKREREELERLASIGRKIIIKQRGFEYGGTTLKYGEFAQGGLVNSPTLSLLGEGRLPEAVVPLPDGRSIPVQMAGGGSDAGVNQTVNVSYTINTPNADSFRRAQPQILANTHADLKRARVRAHQQ